MPSPISVPTLIASSMRLFGALASGEDPSAQEVDDALITLNDLLENWSTENLSVWGAANQTFALVPGQSTYTIGPTGDFNTTRPITVNDGYITFSGVDSPLRSTTQEEYNLISLKSRPGSVPERILYVNEYPLGRLTFWPVPDTAASVTLSLGRLLTSPVVATDVLTGPPGFLKALRYCLAVELAPEFGVTASDIVVSIAADAKGDYKRSNQVDVVSRFDDALTGNLDLTQDWRY